MINRLYNRKMDVTKLFGDEGGKRRVRKAHTEVETETERQTETESQTHTEAETKRQKHKR